MSDRPFGDPMDRAAKMASERDTSAPPTVTPGLKPSVKGIDVERRTIPFYDPKLGSRDFPDYTQQLERLLQHYLGEDSYRRVVELALGHGCQPVHFFRERIWLAMENWDFSAVNAVREKRKREDSDPNNATQKQLVELLTYPVWEKLGDAAREQDVTNLSALKAGVIMALAKHAI